MSGRVKPPTVKFPAVFESFDDALYEVRRNASNFDKPSVFNGFVRVVRYRLTIERVEEPEEVYRARLLELWETCDNHHSWSPLRVAATARGLTLPPGTAGTRRIKP